jgi:hypothetical protein
MILDILDVKVVLFLRDPSILGKEISDFAFVDPHN